MGGNVYLIGVNQTGILGRSHWEEEEVNAKDGDEDDHRLGRLHHHVRVVAIEVVLKMQFGP